MSDDRKRDDETPITFLEWLGLTDSPNFAKHRFIGGVVSTAVFLLLVLALVAAVVALIRSFAATEAGLGTGGLIVALLGAPFLIWSTVLKHQTLRYQKEGHITDRINKAVEQLGAEKKIDRIGRPVTVWTGKPFADSELILIGEKAKIGPRRLLVNKQPVSDQFDDGTPFNGFECELKVWPAERTEIEWRNTPFDVATDEHIASSGDWQAFAETVPNIEVRIGAILSLERIAQDSTKYDKGRDHVRVMEILCAYIRENAPASEAKALPFPRGNKDDEDELLSKRGQHTTISVLLNDTPPPRIDIQMAIKVIGLRSPAQRKVEENSKIYGPKGFVLDLSNCNFQRAELSRMNFSRANLYRSAMDGAHLNDCNLSDANLAGVSLVQAGASRTIFDGANLQKSDLSYLISYDASFENCKAGFTHFVGSQLIRSRFLFESPEDLRTILMNRYFFINCTLGGAQFSGYIPNAVIFHFDAIGKLEYIVRNSAFRQCALPLIFASLETLQNVFGDASVTLPNNITPDHPDWPAHWPKEELDYDDFDTAYKAWLASQP